MANKINYHEAQSKDADQAQYGEQYKNKSLYRKEYITQKVYEDLASGVVFSKILRKLVEDGYNINYHYTDRGARDIITDVKKIIRQDWEESRKDLREQIYTHYMNLYNDCLKNKDRYVASKVLSDIAKLGGVNEPDKVDINSNITIDFGFDIEDED